MPLWLWLLVGPTKAEASAPDEIVSPPSTGTQSSFQLIYREPVALQRIWYLPTYSSSPSRTTIAPSRVGELPCYCQGRACVKEFSVGAAYMQRKYKINPDLHEIQRTLSENLALPVVHSGHLGSPGVQADVDRL